MPHARYALVASAFGIGVTEFIIMGLLSEVSGDLGASVTATGMLISGYALGGVVGALILTIFTASWNRKHVLFGLRVSLIGSMVAPSLVLAIMTVGFENQIAVVALTGRLGAAGFATVPSLQFWPCPKL